MPRMSRRTFSRYLGSMGATMMVLGKARPGTSGNKPVALVDSAESDEGLWRAADHSSTIASYALSKVQRWLHDRALPTIDKKTHLYPADTRWNYRDTAADCYPFLCWAAHVTDLDALNGPVLEVLKAEQTLCNHYGRIPVPYDWKRQRKVTDIPYPEVVFQASEYVKDGLIAIVEAKGKGPWFDRMIGIEEDLWSRADIDMPQGKFISTNVEVNGEQLQALTRLFTMTGDEKFLEWAERLGDYYILNPDYYPSRLRDHGCEIIGGIGLLLAVESKANPRKFRQYEPNIRRIFDGVLARGTNEDGMMYNSLAAQAGEQKGRFSDGWGYNYVGMLCYDLATGTDRYRPQVQEMLGNLDKKIYHNYPWEGTSIDGFADSLEGAIYLVNRLPVPAALAWIDAEMAQNVTRSFEPLETAELWGTMKLQANGVRTVIMHALMHTQGLIARPWRQDLTLGAARNDSGALAVTMSCGKSSAYNGKLCFDRPRYREFCRFAHDWPRMNTLPEWFTVDGRSTYQIEGLGAAKQTVSGALLLDGLPIRLAAGQSVRFMVA